MRLALLLFVTLFALSNGLTFETTSSTPAPISDATLSLIRENLLSSANTSWEIGTMAEALTELSWPSLSVFSDTAFPLPTHLNSSLSAYDVLAIANKTVQSKGSGLALAVDSSAGDPASLGVAVLLANWTRNNLSDTSFSVAANEELTYLLQYAPRTADGAISHRTDQVQLWSDFVYMAPPFIAYFGALNGSSYLLQTAYDQIRLYRNYLMDQSTGLWRHVVLGSWQDNTLWGTGNGWAAAGMLRVLETMLHSESSVDFTQQQTNLTIWIQEILDGTWVHQQTNGTLLNALDDPTSFADSSSTALLASVTYRMAVLTSDTTHIAAANAASTLVKQSIDIDGWLRNTVDPVTFNTPSSPNAVSSEGQAFVLLMESARRDYTAWSSGNTTSPTNPTGPGGPISDGPVYYLCRLKHN